MQIESCIALMNNVSGTVHRGLAAFVEQRDRFNLLAPLPEADVGRADVLAALDSNLFNMNKEVIPAILDLCRIMAFSYLTDGAFRDAYALMRGIINRWLGITHNMAVDRELSLHAGAPVRVQIPTIDELYEQYRLSGAPTGPVDFQSISDMKYPPLGHLMRSFYWNLKGDNCWHLDVERLGDLGADVPSIDADSAAQWYSQGCIFRALTMAIMRKGHLLTLPAEAVPDGVETEPFDQGGFVEVLGTGHDDQMDTETYAKHQEFFESIYLTFLRHWSSGNHFQKDEDKWVAFSVDKAADQFGPQGKRTAAGRNGCIFVTVVNTSGLLPDLPEVDPVIKQPEA